MQISSGPPDRSSDAWRTNAQAIPTADGTQVQVELQLAAAFKLVPAGSAYHEVVSQQAIHRCGEDQLHNVRRQVSQTA